MKGYAWMYWGVGLAAWLTAGAALAHDPIFGIGPHVLFKGGVEIHTGFRPDAFETAMAPLGQCYRSS